mmetsp:Transcript_13132/g.18825  ORF Transcript_13132/g.18825 Transcript_13132/m.18825 type:complete len:546 (+) Transcript_13132:241-1878(+)|eukprot:CAMPEP_0172426504 /NCGR_PEP_ID=MMETSP1064-20121228/37790_1 /TAXON_ID=202472 /ORGANISM="Aulacoseira subarctica , Strain CCAP 1002/5" /LENGTH=545 /DNA_ID=CAMNT_0013170145 /DNA_START=168 /DNA_END=1805 /DNA_ORIENTATION=+
MHGRKGPALFSRRSRNRGCTNAFFGRIFFGLVVAACVLYQISWKSTVEEANRKNSINSRNKVRASTFDASSTPKNEIGPPVDYVTIDGYYERDEGQYYGADDDDIENETTFSVEQQSDDVSARSHGDVSIAEPKLVPKKVLRVALLGERNTGTRWMSSELAKCFPTLNVQPRLVRWKHWFQHDLPHSDGSPQEATLVIAQFRNVYEWTEAMRKVPHHAPMHLHKDWKTFLTIPWTMKRPKRDAPYKFIVFTTTNETTQEPVKPLCFEKFYYNQIVSCIEGSRNDTFRELHGCNPDKDFSCHKPNYELKHNINMNLLTGDAYDSIIDMRRDKIVNFVKEIKEFPWVIGVIHVQYEVLLSEGSDFLLSEIEKIAGVKRQCESTPKQVRKKREISQEMMKWLNDHVDWETESLIGYSKIDIDSAENVYKTETDVNISTDVPSDENKAEDENEKTSADDPYDHIEPEQEGEDDNDKMSADEMETDYKVEDYVKNMSADEAEIRNDLVDAKGKHRVEHSSTEGLDRERDSVGKDGKKILSAGGYQEAYAR